MHTLFMIVFCVRSCPGIRKNRGFFRCGMAVFWHFLFSDRDAGDRKLICGRATRSKEWKPVWDHSFFCAVNIPEMLGWALPA